MEFYQITRSICDDTIPALHHPPLTNFLQQLNTSIQHGAPLPQSSASFLAPSCVKMEEGEDDFGRFELLVCQDTAFASAPHCHDTNLTIQPSTLFIKRYPNINSPSDWDVPAIHFHPSLQSSFHSSASSYEDSPSPTLVDHSPMSISPDVTPSPHVLLTLSSPSPYLTPSPTILSPIIYPAHLPDSDSYPAYVPPSPSPEPFNHVLQAPIPSPILLPPSVPVPLPAPESPSVPVHPSAPVPLSVPYNLFLQELICLNALLDTIHSTRGPWAGHTGKIREARISVQRVITLALDYTSSHNFDLSSFHHDLVSIQSYNAFGHLEHTYAARDIILTTGESKALGNELLDAGQRHILVDVLDFIRSVEGKDALWIELSDILDWRAPRDPY